MASSTPDLASQGNSNAKAFGGILAIVALITGIAAIVRPMQVQVVGLSAEIERLTSSLDDHKDKLGHPETLIGKFEMLHEQIEGHIASPGHPATRTDIASMRVQFTEVETQFRGQRELSQAEVASLHRWIDSELDHLDRRVTKMNGIKQVE